ncbi:unnamed protein product, partial [Closterium sp. NIES-65]
APSTLSSTHCAHLSPPFSPFPKLTPRTPGLCQGSGRGQSQGELAADTAREGVSGLCVKEQQRLAEDGAAKAAREGAMGVVGGRGQQRLQRKGQQRLQGKGQQRLHGKGRQGLHGKGRQGTVTLARQRGRGHGDSRLGWARGDIGATGEGEVRVVPTGVGTEEGDVIAIEEDEGEDVMHIDGPLAQYLTLDGEADPAPLQPHVEVPPLPPHARPHASRRTDGGAGGDLEDRAARGSPHPHLPSSSPPTPRSTTSPPPPSGPGSVQGGSQGPGLLGGAVLPDPHAAPWPAPPLRPQRLTPRGSLEQPRGAARALVFLEEPCSPTPTNTQPPLTGPLPPPPPGPPPTRPSTPTSNPLSRPGSPRVAPVGQPSPPHTQLARSVPTEGDVFEERGDATQSTPLPGEPPILPPPTPLAPQPPPSFTNRRGTTSPTTKPTLPPRSCTSTGPWERYQPTHPHSAPSRAVSPSQVAAAAIATGREAVGLRDAPMADATDSPSHPSHPFHVDDPLPQPMVIGEGQGGLLGQGPHPSSAQPSTPHSTLYPASPPTLTYRQAGLRDPRGGEGWHFRFAGDTPPEQLSGCPHPSSPTGPDPDVCGGHPVCPSFIPPATQLGASLPTPMETDRGLRPCHSHLDGVAPPPVQPVAQEVTSSRDEASAPTETPPPGVAEPSLEPHPAEGQEHTTAHTSGSPPRPPSPASTPVPARGPALSCATPPLSSLTPPPRGAGESSPPLIPGDPVGAQAAHGVPSTASSDATAPIDPADTATSPDQVVSCPTCRSSLANRRALQHHIPFCHPADAARRAQAAHDTASIIPSLSQPRATGMQFTDAQWQTLRLVRIAQDPEAAGPTFLLAAAPTLFLVPATPPDRSHTAAIATRISRFGRGEWAELVSDALGRRTPLPRRTGHRSRTATDPSAADERRIARCLRLAACNETSRACAALESADGSPRYTGDDTAPAVEAPQRGEADPSLAVWLPGVPSRALGGSLTPRDFHSSAGLFGRTQWLRGRCAPAARSLLASSTLVALAKSNMDVRPIAIGEVLVRILSRAVCLQLRDQMARVFLASQQFGVGVTCGTEVVVRGVRRALADHPDWVVLQLDVANAFNSFHRDRMFQALQASPGVSVSDPLHRPLLRDALGSPLQRLALEPVLAEGDVQLWSYADDTYVLGPPDRVLHHFAEIPQTAARLLSACVSTRPQYLSRTVPPSPAVISSFTRWDARLGETFQQLLASGTWACREDVREAALDQIFLPIRLGGFGIRRMARIAPSFASGASRLLEAHALEAVRARHASPLHLARLTSLQGGGAGAWLTSVPYADPLRIPEALWQAASSSRLGLPIPQLALAGQCSCGQAIDDMTVPHHAVRQWWERGHGLRDRGSGEARRDSRVAGGQWGTAPAAGSGGARDRWAEGTAGGADGPGRGGGTAQAAAESQWRPRAQGAAPPGSALGGGAGAGAAESGRRYRRGSGIGRGGQGVREAAGDGAGGSGADPQREGNVQLRRATPTQIGVAAARRVQEKLRHWGPHLEGLQPAPHFYACVAETFGLLSEPLRQFLGLCAKRIAQRRRDRGGGDDGSARIFEAGLTTRLSVALQRAQAQCMIQHAVRQLGSHTPCPLMPSAPPAPTLRVPAPLPPLLTLPAPLAVSHRPPFAPPRPCAPLALPSPPPSPPLLHASSFPSPTHSTPCPSSIRTLPLVSRPPMLGFSPPCPSPPFSRPPPPPSPCPPTLPPLVLGFLPPCLTFPPSCVLSFSPPCPSLLPALPLSFPPPPTPGFSPPRASLSFSVPLLCSLPAPACPCPCLWLLPSLPHVSSLPAHPSAPPLFSPHPLLLSLPALDFPHPCPSFPIIHAPRFPPFVRSASSLPAPPFLPPCPLLSPRYAPFSPSLLPSYHHQPIPTTSPPPTLHPPPSLSPLSLSLSLFLTHTHTHTPLPHPPHPTSSHSAPPCPFPTPSHAPHLPPPCNWFPPLWCLPCIARPSAHPLPAPFPCPQLAQPLPVAAPPLAPSTPLPPVHPQSHPTAPTLPRLPVSALHPRDRVRLPTAQRWCARGVSSHWASLPGGPPTPLGRCSGKKTKMKKSDALKIVLSFSRLPLPRHVPSKGHKWVQHEGTSRPPIHLQQMSAALHVAFVWQRAMRPHGSCAALRVRGGSPRYTGDDTAPAVEAPQRGEADPSFAVWLPGVPSCALRWITYAAQFSQLRGGSSGGPSDGEGLLGSHSSLGVGVMCGTEVVVRGVRRALADHPDWVVLQLDVANAFNSFHRYRMFQALQASPEFQCLIPFIGLFYGTPSDLHYSPAAQVPRLPDESFLSRDLEAFTGLGIEVARRGLTVTGVPVGTVSFVEQSLPDRLERMGRVLPWLPEVAPAPRTAARLPFERVSALCPQYLSRTVPPSHRSDLQFYTVGRTPGRDFSAALASGTWACREDVREAALDQIFLPIRLGGFGIRRMARIAPSFASGASRLLEAHALEAVRARHASPLHLARLTSLQGGGAGAWLTSVPYADPLRIPEALWQAASSSRLGLPIPQLALAGQCSCGQAIDDMTVPHHAVRCPRYGVATTIHDTVKYMLRDFAVEAGFAPVVGEGTRAEGPGERRGEAGQPGGGGQWGRHQLRGQVERGTGGQRGWQGEQTGQDGEGGTAQAAAGEPVEAAGPGRRASRFGLGGGAGREQQRADGGTGGAAGLGGEGQGVREAAGDGAGGSGGLGEGREGEGRGQVDGGEERGRETIGEGAPRDQTGQQPAQQQGPVGRTGRVGTASRIPDLTCRDVGQGLMVLVDVSIADPQREGNVQLRRATPTQIGVAAARRVQEKLRHWGPHLEGLQPTPHFYACVAETFGLLSEPLRQFLGLCAKRIAQRRRDRGGGDDGSARIFEAGLTTRLSVALQRAQAQCMIQHASHPLPPHAIRSPRPYPPRARSLAASFDPPCPPRRFPPPAIRSSPPVRSPRLPSPPPSPPLLHASSFPSPTHSTPCPSSIRTLPLVSRPPYAWFLPSLPLAAFLRPPPPPSPCPPHSPPPLSLASYLPASPFPPPCAQLLPSLPLPPPRPAPRFPPPPPHARFLPSPRLPFFLRASPLLPPCPRLPMPLSLASPLPAPRFFPPCPPVCPSLVFPSPIASLLPALDFPHPCPRFLSSMPLVSPPLYVQPLPSLPLPSSPPALCSPLPLPVAAPPLAPSTPLPPVHPKSHPTAPTLPRLPVSALHPRDRVRLPTAQRWCARGHYRPSPLIPHHAPKQAFLPPASRLPALSTAALCPCVTLAHFIPPPPSPPPPASPYHHPHVPPLPCPQRPPPPPLLPFPTPTLPPHLYEPYFPLQPPFPPQLLPHPAWAAPLHPALPGPSVTQLPPPGTTPPFPPPSNLYTPCPCSLRNPATYPSLPLPLPNSTPPFLPPAKVYTPCFCSLGCAVPNLPPPFRGTRPPLPPPANLCTPCSCPLCPPTPYLNQSPPSPTPSIFPPPWGSPIRSYHPSSIPQFPLSPVSRPRILSCIYHSSLLSVPSLPSHVLTPRLPTFSLPATRLTPTRLPTTLCPFLSVPHPSFPTWLHLPTPTSRGILPCPPHLWPTTCPHTLLTHRYIHPRPPTSTTARQHFPSQSAPSPPPPWAPIPSNCQAPSTLSSTHCAPLSPPFSPFPKLTPRTPASAREARGELAADTAREGVSEFVCEGAAEAAEDGAAKAAREGAMGVVGEGAAEAAEERAAEAAREGAAAAARERAAGAAREGAAGTVTLARQRAEAMETGFAGVGATEPAAVSAGGTAAEEAIGTAPGATEATAGAGIGGGATGAAGKGVTGTGARESAAPAVAREGTAGASKAEGEAAAEAAGRAIARPVGAAGAAANSGKHTAGPAGPAETAKGASSKAAAGGVGSGDIGATGEGEVSVVPTGVGTEEGDVIAIEEDEGEDVMHIDGPLAQYLTLDGEADPAPLQPHVEVPPLPPMPVPMLAEGPMEGLGETLRTEPREGAPILTSRPPAHPPPGAPLPHPHPQVPVVSRGAAKALAFLAEPCSPTPTLLHGQPPSPSPTPDPTVAGGPPGEHAAHLCPHPQGLLRAPRGAARALVFLEEPCSPTPTNTQPPPYRPTTPSSTRPPPTRPSTPTSNPLSRPGSPRVAPLGSHHPPHTACPICSHGGGCFEESGDAHRAPPAWRTTHPPSTHPFGPTAPPSFTNRRGQPGWPPAEEQGQRRQRVSPRTPPSLPPPPRAPPLPHIPLNNYQALPLQPDHQTYTPAPLLHLHRAMGAVPAHSPPFCPSRAVSPSQVAAAAIATGREAVGLRDAPMADATDSPSHPSHPFHVDDPPTATHGDWGGPRGPSRAGSTPELRSASTPHSTLYPASPPTLTYRQAGLRDPRGGEGWHFRFAGDTPPEQLSGCPHPSSPTGPDPDVCGGHPVCPFFYPPRHSA